MNDVNEVPCQTILESSVFSMLPCENCSFALLKTRTHIYSQRASSVQKTRSYSVYLLLRCCRYGGKPYRMFAAGIVIYVQLSWYTSFSESLNQWLLMNYGKHQTFHLTDNCNLITLWTHMAVVGFLDSRCISTIHTRKQHLPGTSMSTDKNHIKKELKIVETFQGVSIANGFIAFIVNLGSLWYLFVCLSVLNGKKI